MIEKVSDLFKLHREVNEEFVNAELEKCKRKIGGKRKIEQVNEKGGVQGKLPKLIKETLEDQQVKENLENRLKKEDPKNQQEKKNPEDRLKKNDDLKENSEVSKVIKI